MDDKGVCRSDTADVGTEFIDMPYEQVVACAAQQVNGEEVGAALVPGASIVGHATLSIRF
jgi:hypothetical protein